MCAVAPASDYFQAVVLCGASSVSFLRSAAGPPVCRRPVTGTGRRSVAGTCRQSKTTFPLQVCSGLPGTGSCGGRARQSSAALMSHPPLPRCVPRCSSSSSTSRQTGFSAAVALALALAASTLTHNNHMKSAYLIAFFRIFFFTLMHTASLSAQVHL